MQIFRCRPLAVACFAFLISVAIGLALPFSSLLICLAVLGTILAVGVVLLRVKLRRSLFYSVFFSVFLTLLFVFLAFLRCIGPDRRSDEIASYMGEDCYAQGVVVEETASVSNFSVYLLEVDRLNGVSLNFNCILECDFSAGFHVGDAIEVHAALLDLREYEEVEENYRYARSQGTMAALVCTSWQDAVLTNTNQAKITSFFADLRCRLSLALQELAGKDNGSLASALFLGERDQLPDEIGKSFNRSGVSHLLALSGLHISIILLLFTRLFRFVGIPQKGRIVLLIVLALFYLYLIGFRITAVRAVVMVCGLYAAELSGEQNDSLTSLCFTGFLLVLFSPLTVLDAGFLMSFWAVFGLVAIMPYFDAWLKTKSFSSVWKKIGTAFMAALVATVAVSAVSWLFVGEISLVGIPMTVILTPLVTIILTLSPFMLLLYYLPFVSYGWMGQLYSWLLSLLRQLTDFVGNIRHITVSLSYPFVGIILCSMAILLFILLVLPLKKKRVLILPPICAVLAFGICLGGWTTANAGSVDAAYIVGKSGEQVLLTDYESNQSVLIDTSSGAYNLFSRTRKVMQEKAVTEVDVLLLTHYHRAFVYSTERFARKNTLRSLYVPVPQTEAEWYILAALKERLEPLHVCIYQYDKSRSLRLFEDCRFEMIADAYLKRSSQPIQVYCFSTPDESLLRVPLAASEIDVFPTIQDQIKESEFLLLSDHGPIPKTRFELGLEESTLKLCLMDDMKNLSLLYPADEETYRALLNRPFYADIREFFFQISK